MTDAILDLPTEVQLNILSWLPAKEIQRSRDVCKHFRNLVDNKSNMTLLARPGQLRSLYKLDMQLNHALIFNNCHADFIECLDRFLGLSGLWLHPLTMQAIATRFKSHWLQQSNLVDENGPLEIIPFATSFAVWFITSYLLEAHLRTHVDEAVDKYKFTFELDDGPEQFAANVIEAMGEESLGIVGITEEDLVEWWEEVVFTPGGRFATPARPVSERVRPIYPLTPLEAIRADPQTGEPVAQVDEGICDHETVEEILGVHDMPFGAYTVRTKTAYDQVKRAVDGEEMGGLVKASVLEELYWFVAV